MTRFVDTTLRLLSQDPLARTLSSATVLHLAERLDEVGYSALEAGAAMLPLALGLVMGAGASNKLAERLGRTRVIAGGLVGVAAVH